MTGKRACDELGQKILNTAESLFHMHGVENVSMHQVARTAGIGQGTLYRRYANKGRLCFSLMEAQIDCFMEQLDLYLRESSHEPAGIRIRIVMMRIILHFNANLEWLRIILNSERLEDAKATLEDNAPFTYLRKQLKDLLEEGMEQGGIRPVDPEFASILLGSLPRADIILYLRDKGYSAEEIAEQYCRCFIDPLLLS